MGIFGVFHGPVFVALSTRALQVDAERGTWDCLPGIVSLPSDRTPRPLFGGAEEPSLAFGGDSTLPTREWQRSALIVVMFDTLT